MSGPPMVAVSIGRGLAVWHTREQWDAFMRGVDMEAARLHDAPLETEPEEEEQ